MKGKAVKGAGSNTFSLGFTFDETSLYKSDSMATIFWLRAALFPVMYVALWPIPVWCLM